MLESPEPARGGARERIGSWRGGESSPALECGEHLGIHVGRSTHGGGVSQQSGGLAQGLVDSLPNGALRGGTGITGTGEGAGGEERACPRADVLGGEVAAGPFPDIGVEVPSADVGPPSVFGT